METVTTGLTVGGWIFLVLAWTFIFGLVGFCFRKILRGDTRYDPE